MEDFAPRDSSSSLRITKSYGLGLIARLRMTAFHHCAAFYAAMSCKRALSSKWSENERVVAEIARSASLGMGCHMDLSSPICFSACGVLTPDVCWLLG